MNGVTVFGSVEESGLGRCGSGWSVGVGILDVAPRAGRVD